MTDCPGYVNAKVDIWPTTSPSYRPLGNYDVLVSCPPTFSMSFSLPLQAADVTRSTTEDCILECVFDDGKNVHRLLLRPPFDPRRSSEPPQQPTERNETVERSYNDCNLDSDLPTFGVSVLLVTSITLILVSLFCEVFRETKVRRRRRRLLHAGVRLPANCDGSTVASSSSLLPASRSVHPLRQLSVAARRTCVSAYVTVRLIYAFTFTFSVFTTLVSVALRQQVDVAATTTSTSKSAPTADVGDDSAATARLQMIRCLAGTTIQLTGTGKASSRRFAAVADVVVSSIGSARTAAAQWARQSAEQFVAGVDVGLRKHRHYEQMTSLNDWLLFPRALYNKTTETGNRTSSTAKLTSNEAFWNFLQLTPVDVDLSLWTVNILER